MSIEEWIGSLISLLAFATLLFLNKRKERRGEKPVFQEEVVEDSEDEEDEEAWSLFLKGAAQAPKPIESVKKVVQALPKTAHPPLTHFDEESHDLQVKRTELKSSSILKLKRLPSVHGELSERSPRIKRIVEGLPSLRTMMICHEVLEKPKR